jgi:hypothetical protein
MIAREEQCFAPQAAEHGLLGPIKALLERVFAWYSFGGDLSRRLYNGQLDDGGASLKTIGVGLAGAENKY